MNLHEYPHLWATAAQIERDRRAEDAQRRDALAKAELLSHRAPAVDTSLAGEFAAFEPFDAMTSTVQDGPAYPPMASTLDVLPEAQRRRALAELFARATGDMTAGQSDGTAHRDSGLVNEQTPAAPDARSMAEQFADATAHLSADAEDVSASAPLADPQSIAPDARSMAEQFMQATAHLATDS